MPVLCIFFLIQVVSHFLRFHHFIWSFQVYTVKIKKRPTILWCLIQRGLLPCSQNFVNLWFHLLIIYILWLLYELLAQFASSLTMVVTQTGINGPHATLLAILTYTNVMLSPQHISSYLTVIIDYTLFKSLKNIKVSDMNTLVDS